MTIVDVVHMAQAPLPDQKYSKCRLKETSLFTNKSTTSRFDLWTTQHHLSSFTE